jgi:serine/threonine protein kinase
LQHAFEHGLVHRDIKPSNLLVAQAEGTPFGLVKILDFGLARVHARGDNEQTLTKEGAVLGTPAYVAPEQALNARQADIRSDVYSLGCTFYFLLTGRPPFTGETATETMLKHHLEVPESIAGCRPDVPALVVAIVDRAMAKRPEQRFATPIELAAALAPFAESAANGSTVALLSTPLSARRPAAVPQPLPAQLASSERGSTIGQTALGVTDQPRGRSPGRRHFLLLVGVLARVTP